MLEGRRASERRGLDEERRYWSRKMAEEVGQRWMGKGVGGGHS
jgi:hypothetical protein